MNAVPVAERSKASVYGRLFAGFESRWEHGCLSVVQGGSNITGTNGDLFTHSQSRSYLNHLVCVVCCQ